MSNDPRVPGNHDGRRRAFLSMCAGAAGACAAGALGAPLVVQLVAPMNLRTVRGGDAPVDLGPLRDFAPGRSIRVVVRGPSTDAWAVREEELGPVLVSRSPDGSTLAAFSATCPHLGCAVDVAPDQGRFFCPCHDSFFGPAGQVETGPSPRGLDPLEVWIQNDRVLLRYRRFQLGRPDRVEV
jgi:menaquinol-cytochrome c reductase iron-sulfur subunit